MIAWRLWVRRLPVLWVREEELDHLAPTCVACASGQRSRRAPTATGELIDEASGLACFPHDPAARRSRRFAW